jgi:hypothetical protein
LKEIAMNNPPHSEPKRAAAPIEPEAPRARKWADLHSALAQLIEAQGLARAEEPEQTGVPE